MSVISLSQMRRSMPSALDISTFLTHVLGLVILFVIPELLLSISERGIEIHPGLHVYLKAAVYIMVFYINYFIIVEYTLVRHVRLGRFMLYTLILIIVALLILSTGLMLGRHQIPPPPPFQGHKAGPDSLSHPKSFVSIQLLRDTIMMVLAVGLGTAIKLTYKLIEQDMRRVRTHSSKREEELNRLKSQLHPHFLFNTLNSIYALIDISPDSARDAVHRLSGMLRYVLYEDRQRVTLKREVDFIDHYIRLMKLRLPHSNMVNVRLDCSTCLEMEVPPLIFINLVENAFKHGNTGNPSHNIEISITGEADGTVTCSTVNHFNRENSQSHREGVGMTNLRRRLNLIYGAAASITTHTKGDMYFATLIIKTKQPNTIQS